MAAREGVRDEESPAVVAALGRRPVVEEVRVDLGLDGVPLRERGEPDGSGDGRGEPGLARPQQRLVDRLDGGASARLA